MHARISRSFFCVSLGAALMYSVMLLGGPFWGLIILSSPSRATRCPAAAHNLEEFLLPTPGALDSSDASDRWEFSPSDAETRQRNVYTPEPALETPRFPNIVMRPTERNTPDHLFPRGGRAPQISPVQASPAPANSRSRTRSC